MQQELVKAVSGPLATKQRAAIKATSEAQQRLDKVQGPPQDSGNEPTLLGPTHSPTDTSRLEQAEVEAQAASQELERMSAQREPVAQSIRTISKAYHLVDLERGVRRNAPLMAADIQAQVDQVRAIAQHEGLSQSALDRIDKAQRVVPNMQATIAFVSGYVTQQVSQLDLTPPLSFAMHAKLIRLDLPRKRECLTAIHNFFPTRSDGTTAAERFFGQKPRSMFAAILASVELPPAPLSPPRKP